MNRITWSRGRDKGAQNAAKQRYNTKTYDQVKIYVRKGGRDVIQTLAAAAGMSMAEYIRHCIIMDADRHEIDVRDSLGGGGVEAIKARICDNFAGGGWL